MQYYETINAEVHRRLGRSHSARLLVWSCDQQEYIEQEKVGNWPTVGEKLGAAAQVLEAAGCEGLLIACNSVHQGYERAQSAVSVPILHISEVAADALLARGLRRIALFGTLFTCHAESYMMERLERRGLEVVLAPEPERAELHDIIFEELTLGVVSEGSRRRFGEMLRASSEEGEVDAVLLACTELAMLEPCLQPGVGEAQGGPPLLDTAQLHAMAAVDFMLSVKGT